MNLEFITEYFSGQNLDIIIKLGISLLLGLIIGFEREVTNKNAGLRTHILVCVGSTIFTILSIHAIDFVDVEDGIKLVNDPSRIAAQILTGIGFIGGGAVLHYGINVFGITTAATLWMSASIGMSVGFGAYFMGVFATLLTIIVLVVIRSFENAFIPGGFCRGNRIKASITCLPEHQEEIHKWFNKEFKNVQEVSVNQRLDKSKKIKASYIIELSKKDPVNHIYNKASKLDIIESLLIEKTMI